MGNVLATVKDHMAWPPTLPPEALCFPDQAGRGGGREIDHVKDDRIVEAQSR